MPVFKPAFDGFVETRSNVYSFDLIALHSRPLVWTVCQIPAGYFVADMPCVLFDPGYDVLFDPFLVSWANNDPRVNELGKRFLLQHQDERFFLWLYYVGPHSTYYPSDSFRPLSSEITPQREQRLRAFTFWDLVGEEVIRNP